MIRSVCLVAMMYAASAGAQTRVSVLAGPESGTVFQAAGDLVAAGPSCGLAPDVRTSGGAIASIEELAANDEVKAAIVAADVLDYLRSYAGIDPNIAEKIAGVELALPLFSNELHVIARPEIESVADLEGTRVAVGDLAGATFLTATIALDFLGVAPSARDPITLEAALPAFRAGDIAAIFLVDGVPSQRIIDAGLTAEEAHLLPVDDPFLIESYLPAKFRNGDYAFVEDDVPTIAVRQFLVTDVNPRRDPQGCAAIADYVAFVARSHVELSQSGHPKWVDMNPDADLFDWNWSQCAERGLRADHDLVCE